MKILTVEDIRKIVGILGLEVFFQRVITALENDFRRWDEFILSPRHATHYDHGVIELMPCSDRRFYSFKYVNGHPLNPEKGKLSVVAIGQLNDVETGYPLLISEMTLLTAFRSAATGALAAAYLAREQPQILAIIGTGAQAEFQANGFASVFPLEEIRFYDNDVKAMEKFFRNMHKQKRNFSLTPCAGIAETVRQADIIVTATAFKKRQSLFQFEDIAPGAHIHAMGGDCPGKTEFAGEFLSQAKVVVEYMPQTLIEGEVQQCSADSVYAELWELIGKNKPGRVNDQEITFFDAVGFALEDYSILRVVYELAGLYQLGTESALIPQLNDPKDLYAVLAR